MSHHSVDRDASGRDREGGWHDENGDDRRGRWEPLAKGAGERLHVLGATELGADAEGLIEGRPAVRADLGQLVEDVVDLGADVTGASRLIRVLAAQPEQAAQA